MLMFDPQYIRPDDVGTQRNKTLILAPSDSVQESEAVAYRSRDQAGGDAVVPVVTHERRKPDSRERRRQVRRQQNQACLLDTRTNRERRSLRRRQQDVLPLEPEQSSNVSRLGINEVI